MKIDEKQEAKRLNSLTVRQLDWIGIDCQEKIESEMIFIIGIVKKVLSSIFSISGKKISF